jgi:hydrogenase-4 membrane subunit HyfE
MSSIVIQLAECCNVESFYIRRREFYRAVVETNKWQHVIQDRRLALQRITHEAEGQAIGILLSLLKMLLEVRKIACLV